MHKIKINKHYKNMYKIKIKMFLILRFLNFFMEFVYIYKACLVKLTY